MSVPRCRLHVAFLSLLIASMSLPAWSGESKAGDRAAAEAVLRQYKAALERLDLTGIDRLFAAENTVVESGKLEGGYADYLANHIGPELGHFNSFKLSDYAVDTRMEGDIALATETYRYTIVLKDKPEPIARQAVATSVLKKIDGRWQIIGMHSSSRALKPVAAQPEQ